MDKVIEGQQQGESLGTIFTYSPGITGIIERAVSLYLSSSLTIFPSAKPEFAYIEGLSESSLNKVRQEIIDTDGNRLPFARVCQNLFKEESILLGINPINDIAEICLMAPARLPGVRSIRTLKQMIQGTDNVIENLGQSGTCFTSAVALVIIAKTFYPDIGTDMRASRVNNLPTYKLTWYEGGTKMGAIFNGNRSRYRNRIES